MANTVIQLKFSTVTDKPVTLNIAEPAYSYSSNTFFIGSPSGTGSIAIGGQFYVNQQGLIFNHANAAFAAANNSVDAYVRPHANAAFDHANAAFNTANTADAKAVTAGSYANSAFVAANTADAKAVSAGSYANSAFNEANTAITNAATADSKAVSAGSYANSAFDVANSAFASSNTKLATSGGTISGSLTVTGNLVVQGNTTFVDTEILTVEDSLIKLASNNTTDAVDIGFYGQYGADGTKYTGLARTAGSNNFFLFQGLTEDPASNTLASGSVTAANAATLIANVQAYSVTINGVNTETYIGNAFAAANTADAKAVSAGSYANSAFAHANAGFNVANTASSTATAAGSYSNSAFSVANTADAKAVSAGSYANSAFTHANAAFEKANTDFTNVSITAGDFGSASAVASFKVEANGRISSANSTSIAIDTSAITSGTLGVARGGTGASSFTNNGVLLGQGTSALSTASSTTEGHVLTINASGVPSFAHLQGGTF